MATPREIADRVSGARYVAGWSAKTGDATYNAATGDITSLGAELSGYSGTTLAQYGKAAPLPKWNNTPGQEGFICLGQYDVATASRGMGIKATLGAPPAGAWYHRKLLCVAVVTPINQGGDYVSADGGAMRIISDNNASTVFSLHKLTSKGTSGSSANSSYLGFSQVNGAASLAITTKRTGSEMQAVGAYSVSGTNVARGYTNTTASESPTANNNTGTFTAVNVGFLDGAGATGQPFNGIVHAFYVLALDNTTGADFSQTDLQDLLAYAAAEWGVETGQTKMISVCGDSIGYGGGQKFDQTVNTAASGATNTTLNGAHAIGATSLTVASTTGFSATAGANRYTLDPGTEIAETVEVSAVTDGTHLAIATTALRFAHSSGAVLANAAHGFLTPSAGCWKKSAVFGHGKGHIILNFAQPSTQLSQVQNATAEDGATRVFDAVSAGGRTLFVQRGSNDINAGTSAATLLGYANTYATQAAAMATPPDKIIGVEVLKRQFWSAGSNAIVASYNSSLRGSANFHAVAKLTDHSYLNNVSNAGSVTVVSNGTIANAATTITGSIFDPPGVHPHAFGYACMALMLDKAYATAWATTTGYAPAAPTVTATKEAGGMRLNWTAPASTGAPTMDGDTSAGASCLCVRIKKNGSNLVLIAPLTVSAVTGAATYTTTYLDSTYTPGDTYTLSVEDAAGNASGDKPVILPSLGRAVMSLGVGLAF